MCICDFVGNLRKHERTHQSTDSDDSSGVYTCRECRRQLRSAAQLRRHTARCHMPRGAARLTCAQCARSFMLPTDLRRHIAFTHTQHRTTYRCCYCGVCCRHYQVNTVIPLPLPLPLLLQPLWLYDPLSGTTQVSRYQKDKPFWILLRQT